MKIKCLNKINWRPKELNPIFIEKLIDNNHYYDMKIKCLNKINWRPKELNPIFIEKLIDNALLIELHLLHT
jgi:hypothetical protein